MASRLPDLLRQYRRTHGISQQKLAEILNTVQSYISRIEGCERPSKNSDVDFLRRVSDRLHIDPQELGLLRDGPITAQRCAPPEALEAWRGAVELAESARSRGDPEIAVRRLYPIVSALECEHQLKPEEPSTTDLFVRAKLIFGTALGDCVPSNGLGEALQHLRTANDSLQVGDRELKIQVLRAYGNELRKSGEVESALSVLRQAQALVPPRTVNGSLAIAIARAQAEVGNWQEFRRSINDAWRALDKQIRPRPLFNELVVREVLLRGLLRQADLCGVETELGSSFSIPLNSAPQWRIIYAVTEAEALLITRDLAGGARAAKEALVAARQATLPQQIKRIHDIISRFCKLSGELNDLFEIAKRELLDSHRTAR